MTRKTPRREGAKAPAEDRPNGSVLASWRHGSLAFALLLFACSGIQRIPDPPAELRVVAEPPTAIVYVNERFAGTARVLEKKPAQMKPGRKRITVQAPGYFPHDLELDLPSGVTKIAIKLRPVPP